MFVVLSANISFCEAQTFGGTAPSVRWKQINTKEARIIFPAGLDTVADKVAGNIQIYSEKTLESIGSKMRKINIVFRNEGLISNGYVGLAPFRSEFYLTPTQNVFALGSIPWPEQLAAHEYRHVQQYSNFDVGLSHVMRLIFGSEGQALANSGSVPDWFFEGDAVFNETVLTKQGRGVLPYFYNGYRALIREGKNYNWMKLRNGSYLHYTPDRYTLGYMLTVYGRQRFGDEFWRNVTHDAASFKKLFYPLQKSLQRYSGLHYSQFRDSAFRYFNQRFEDPPGKLQGRDYLLNEKFPVFNTDGNLLYLKSSVKDIPVFVVREEGKEKKIRTADFMFDNYFSYGAGKIAYASGRYHPRWASRSYHEIQVLDVRSGKQKTLTHKTRYFSPAIDGNGERIVAVNSGEDGAASLDLLDISTGKVIESYTGEDIYNFYFPQFYDHSIVSCIADREGRMSIARIDTETRQIRYLLPLSFNVIGYPYIASDTLYFTASHKQNDELFAYSFRDGKIWKISGTVFSLGKYNVAVSKDSVAWSSFTSEGMRLQVFGKNQMQYVEITPEEFVTVPDSYGIKKLTDNDRLSSEGDSSVTVNIKKYVQLTSPINFHSLEPEISDPEYAVTLVGENILNTLQTNLSFTYNRSDKSRRAGVGFLYGGLFPVFSFGYNYRFSERFVSGDRIIRYNISSPYAGFYVPLTLSRRRSFRGLTFGSNISYNRLMIEKAFKNWFRNSSSAVLTNSFTFFNQSQTATAQILPRFAQILSVNYKLPVNRTPGYQYQIKGKFYVPGVMKTHSLNFVVGYSARDTFNMVGFSGDFPFSRGYEGVSLHEMTALQVNYQFPVFYPEWGTANIVYFMRVRANLFYDLTHVGDFTVSGERRKNNFNSFGTEINFDTRWWNQSFVSFGIRYSHLLNKDLFGGDNRNRWEIILPINLFNDR